MVNPRVLYRPAALRTAATTGRWIWIAEGEKDADTLTALGRLATTNAQGAANFPDEPIAQFHGVKVAIVADRDCAGYQRARDLYRRLKGVAAEIAVLLPAVETDKSDVTEHVEARLWRSDEPFGGLLAVTSDELHALAVSAAARAAGHRFDVAVAEARAHQHRRGTVAGSARAAARWLAEAAHQLRTVQDAARNLQRHHSDHPYAVRWRPRSGVKSAWSRFRWFTFVILCDGCALRVITSRTVGSLLVEEVSPDPTLPADLTPVI